VKNYILTISTLALFFCCRRHSIWVIHHQPENWMC